ncbi:MAG: hypothetical protein ACQEXX_19855 [Bacillota bacterium]
MNKIDEIKESLAAATPGPWEVYEWGNDEGYAVYQHPVGMQTSITGWGRVLQTKENAHLIAKAPEYITYLLQLVERQKEELEFYAEEGNYLEHIIGWGPNIPVLQDGGKRARKALETAL